MLLEKLIRKLKRDPSYQWESTYSIAELVLVTCRRLIQISRGLFVRPFLKSSSGILFLGSRVKLSHCHQLTTGKNTILEDNVYINSLSENGIVLGDNVSIARDSILFCTGVIAQKGRGIKIGNGTGVSARAYFSGQGGIEIGTEVIFGPDVKIFSENHNYDDLTQTIKAQGVSRKGVLIGNNCWIGGGVTILDGVTIGDGCVIAAGSVVNKSIPQNSVAAGIPARIIKNRNDQLAG